MVARHARGQRGFRRATLVPRDVDLDGSAGTQSAYTALRPSLGKRREEVDCAIGSRWLPGSVMQQTQSLKRRIFSRCFHIYVELLFHMHIKDTQCGAKVMRKEVVESVHSALRIADVAFDINLLYSIKRNGFTIREVPTVWKDQIGSKINLNRGSLGILLSVLRLRLVYSPFYEMLRPFRPLEGWIYKKLRAPQPLPGAVIPKRTKERDEGRAAKAETNSSVP